MKKIFQVMLLLVLVSIACDFSFGGTQSPAEAPAAATTESETTSETLPVVGEGEATPLPTIPATVAPFRPDPEAEPVEFSGHTDYSQLSSYRIDFVTEHEGTSAEGQPLIQRREIFIEATQPPLAKHIRQKVINGALTEGAAGASITQIEHYEVGSIAYSFNSATGGGWTATLSPDSEIILNQGLFAPQTLLKLPATGRLSLEKPVINGIPTHHYRITESSNIIDDRYQYRWARGDIWIAVGDNYIVKYDLEAEVQLVNVSPGQQALPLLQDGRILINFELSDVNGEMPILVPAEITDNLDVEQFE